MIRKIPLILSTLLLGLVCSFQSFGQIQTISEELKARYYSSDINIGGIDQKLYDSLTAANTLHPSRFYEICGSFIQDSMMNEAAVAYFIGKNRYRIYNKTNPKYKASEDGALAGSFDSMFGEALIQYLNKNIENYSVLVRKSGEWYRDNKHYYFKDSENDSLYQLQITGMFKFADELKNTPLNYINDLEAERLEIEEMMRQFNEDIEESIDNEDAETDGDAETESTYRSTSETPEAFFSNYNGDHFIVNKENEISAVAHGYYDTYIESADAEIIQNENNPLHYKIKPPKDGNCVIKLYGVNEKGQKVQLAGYAIKLVQE